MGLLKAGIGAMSGVLADQWRDYFSCDALTHEELVVKAYKKTSKRSSNTKASADVITNGSIIAINEGQCMLIVEQGKVVEVCAEPGEYVYDTSSEPTIFYGELKKGIIDSFKTLGKRFTFGGEPAKDQRVYFVNIKEILNNKYGTVAPVPFRVVDHNVGLDIDIAIRCHGDYTYKITDPIKFYTNVCGNVEDVYLRETIDSQLKSEFLTALQPAFAKISTMGIRYSALPGHTTELAQAMNDELSEKWTELRGIDVISVGVSGVKAPDEDEKMIKELQRNAALRNPNMAAAHLVGAQAQAMQDAAKNEGDGGAFMAFAGMNMANNASGNTANNLFQMNHEQEKPNTWTCSCGQANTGNFCLNCGKPKTTTANWQCSCGMMNTGNFCSNCGASKPQNKLCPNCQSPLDAKAKFCSKCGHKVD